MNEKRFWELVDVLDGRVDETSVARLQAALEQLPPREITAFEDHLALSLFQLDTAEHAAQQVRDVLDPPDAPVLPLSDDAFLYLRCAVVASGRASFRKVARTPAALAGTWAMDGELLLSVAGNAWTAVTGTEWTHRPPVSYETGSNPDGWAEGAVCAGPVAAGFPGGIEGLPAEEYTRDGRPIGEWWLVEVHDRGLDPALFADPGLDPDALAERLGVPAGTMGIGMPFGVTFRSLPRASTRVTEVLRAAGADEGGFGRGSVLVGLHDAWSRDDVHGCPAWSVPGTVMFGWSPDEADAAVTALGADLTLQLLAGRDELGHPAVPGLRRLVDAGRALLPGAPLG